MDTKEKIALGKRLLIKGQFNKAIRTLKAAGAKEILIEFGDLCLDMNSLYVLDTAIKAYQAAGEKNKLKKAKKMATKLVLLEWQDIK